VNGNLLFAGTEFALFFSVDGGSHWVQLKGGLPTAQYRDLAIQKRENDLVAATFGRGFYVLDDYSPLREVSAQALSQEAELFPLRTAYAYDEHSYVRPVGGDEATPNPPYGAVFTYSVGSASASSLVITIADSTGKQVRRLTIPPGLGVHREAWNLLGDPGPGQGGGGRGGRGGGGGGALVPPGRYTATLGKLTGETVTPIGKPQSFLVMPVPDK
jgi:hypothetical protein